MATLADVYEDYRSDRRFDHLRTEGIVLVGGEGSSRPKLFIVGEAPGATENTQRRPFVGASGRVLRSLIIDSAELESQDYFLTTTLKYHTPGNRTPTPEEIEASKPYLRREWHAAGRAPILVAVGAVAVKALSTVRLPRPGVPISLTGGRALWPMIHPEYGIRHPEVQPDMESHWQALGRFVKEELG